MQSAGKYGPGTGAFLLPCYGAGELPQVTSFSMVTVGMWC